MAYHDKKSGESCIGKGCQRINVPTDDEVEALKALRTIKDRVREIKKRISNLSESISDEAKEEISRLQDEMEAFNIEWKDWEKKRDEAARERMILLGHIEP
ncbi:MAG: hypothetical protein JW932_10325 [Deltaproteobacteria bacterium]|nr:hypothetical protein [Deltaproteobacteria bacterium]